MSLSDYLFLLKSSSSISLIILLRLPHQLQKNILMSYPHIEAKKYQIRAKKRKEELQQIFNNKRKLLLSSMPISSKPTFIQICQSLWQRKNVFSSLVEMANLLADEKPFENFDSKGPPESSQLLQETCLNLSRFVLGELIGQFKDESNESIRNRKSCIILIANLLADPQIINEPYYAIFKDFLSSFYSSVEIWGIDEEIVEVGWMVANLIGKPLTCNIHQQHVMYIFEWIEELIKVPDPIMLCTLYSNLSKFIKSVQELYSVQPAELPQVYKSNIINIIADTIKSNLLADLPQKMLARAVNFLSTHLYISLAYCPSMFCESLIKNSMQLLGLLSQQVVKEVFKLFNMAVNAQINALVPHQRKILESMERIRLYIVGNYSVKLMQNMMVREIKYKRLMFQFLHSLLQAPSKNTLELIATLAGAGLEDVLVNLYSFQDHEVKLDCKHLAILIHRLSNGDYGQQIIHKIEELEHLTLMGIANSSI